MILAIGCDHGGYLLKEIILGKLKGSGYTVIDYGANAMIADDDYPDYTKKVGECIQQGKAEKGILICGSGVGASIAANKMKGIRAALCVDTFSAHQGVEDDKMNVLCLGGRVVAESLAWELVISFLNAKFSGLERHVRRLAKVEEMEKNWYNK
jgi:ribose 5-phosphate isomerase B